MSRELIFRAWDKMDKRMIVQDQDFIPLKVTNIGVLKLDPTSKEDRWILIDPERFELMQYTGLMDRNEVKIYEGDIIRWHDIVTSDYPITFTNGVFCLADRTDENLHHHQYEIGLKWEVVGNLYETPELLR